MLNGRGASLSFRPDGRFLAAAGSTVTTGSRVTVWDVNTGQQSSFITPNLNARTLATQNDVRGLAYSPDGRRLLTWGRRVGVWDAVTGAELITLAGSPCGAWSPDGRRIAVGCHDGTAKVFDAATGLELFAQRGHAGEVQGVAFSPDGSLLASGGQDRTVRLWDPTHGQEVRLLNEGNFLTGNHRFDGLAFSQDGKKIGFAFAQGTHFKRELAVKVCAADTGRDLLTLTGLGTNFGYPQSVRMAFSPDGKRFAVVTGDYVSHFNKVRVWDLATGREGPSLEASQNIDHVLFSPDGKTIAIATPNRLSLHDLSDGREVLSLDGWYHSTRSFAARLAFSPDGSLAAVVGPDPNRELRLLEVPSGKVVRTMSKSDGKPIAVTYRGTLAFSADGRRLILYDLHGTGRIFVWDSGSGQLLHSHDGPVGVPVERFGGGGFVIPDFSCALSPDGSRLAIARPTVPMQVSLWDTATGQEVFTIKSASQVAGSNVQALGWSADGTTLAVADEYGDVRLWSAAPRTEQVQEARRAAWGDYALAWHRRAARDCERERQWFAAAFHLSRVIDASPADGSLFLRRGLVHAQAERWAEAADDIGRAIESRFGYHGGIQSHGAPP